MALSQFVEDNFIPRFRSDSKAPWMAHHVFIRSVIQCAVRLAFATIAVFALVGSAACAVRIALLN